jgi:hypothetical protein
VLLDPAEVVDLHRPGEADAREVVPHEVDDHDVLGVVLDEQLAPGRSGALDRPRRDHAVTAQQVGLR